MNRPPLPSTALGGTGIAVTRLILGCGNFGGVGSAPQFFGRGTSHDDALALLDAAWEAGITTLDTADAYGGGTSEQWIGEWLAGKPAAVRDAVTIATKTFNPMGVGADHGLHPARIRRQVDESLRRLGVERVGLYLAHEFDPDVPVADTLGAFAELIAAGKIGAVGASNVDAAQLGQALAAHDADPTVARYQWVQNSYSLLDRRDDQDVLPLCRQHGLGYTPFGPLAGGWLTGKYRRDRVAPAGSRMTMRPEPYAAYDSPRVYAALDRFAARAATLATTPAALAVAWLLVRPGVSAVVIGPNRADQLGPMLDAAALVADGTVDGALGAELEDDFA